MLTKKKRKMKKFKNLKVLALLLTVTLFTSCIVDDEADVSLSEGPYVLGFQNAVEAENYFADQGTVLAEYPVLVLGGSDGAPLPEPVTINYSIDPASTAVEGQEFEFVSNTGTIVIPAGATFGNFPLNILTGGFDPGVPTQLIINLTSTNSLGSVISSKGNSVAITFVGCLSTLDQENYALSVSRNGNTTVYTTRTGIDFEDVNVFQTQRTGTFTPGQQGTDPARAGLSFTDICGDLTIPTQGLYQGQFSNQVTDDGSGPVDANGNFELNFSVSGVTGGFTHTYTKL